MNARSNLDKIKIRPLTDHEITKIKEELVRYDEEYDNHNRPGKYTLADNCRGEKIKEKFCVFCKENLERVYTINRTFSLDTVYGSKEQSWSLLCVRCSKCGLKYELLGL